MSGVCLVTGGSRGIGAAAAHLAAARGYAVAVNYARNERAANAVVAAIRADGGRAIAIGGDVAAEEDVLRMFDLTERELGPLTALVNNAGIVGPTGPIAELTASDLTRLLAVNVTGVILCAREAVRRMGSGSAIVNLSSLAARLGSAHEYVGYAASKAAVDTFTIGLAREVASQGIRVNAVAPGLIETEIHSPGRLDRLRSAVPMQRCGTAEEVAEAILWLLSSASSYVTGSILEIGGGR
jgi:NAD(P)-dependent dehydrogenase (short-subunit alcohol dehydrogenase family)